MKTTTNPRKTSAYDRNSHRLNKQFVKRTSLPFVLFLALIGAVIATGLTIGNRRQKIGGIASSDQHPQVGTRVGKPRQISPPKTAAVDPATPSPALLGNSVGAENELHSSSSVMPPPTPSTTVARSTGIPQVVEMTIGEDTEQSSQNSPVLRSVRIPYSAAAANNGERARERSQEQEAGRVQQGESATTSQRPDRTIDRRPREERLVKAHEFKGDVRNLPRTRPQARERRELEAPEMNPSFYVPPGGVSPQSQTPEQGPSITPQANAPASPPGNVFEGLDRFNWGAGSPPDTNGDVGPNYFIQTVNTSIGIFRKTDGFMEAGFTFNTFMSQGNFGNLCDTNNFGDPVVLYDTFEDRWIITDFAFMTDISGNVLGPSYQCIAASQTGNPLTGGWNFYSRQIPDALGDYPKFGIWPDGLYMSANMFTYGAGSTFKSARAYAFNKAQMYAGSPTVKVLSFDIGGGDFTVVPSNARLQTGTPPSGRPNLFLSSWLFTNALTAYKFHVDWNNISLSTFTGPDTPIAATSWPNAAVANAPQPGTATLLDVLQIRAMVQNQYTNFGGTESLWLPQTVRRANTTGFAAPRWYQVSVTGGTVAASIPQAATWDPNGANVIHRFMPSLALDRTGNMAMGYSTSNSTTEFPSIKYAGRLAGDPVNTFSQTEQTFFTGTASQLSSTRWGDYSSMTLDPDGCRFWITNEYATGLDNTTVDPSSFNKRWKTKFGSIPAFPGCIPVGAGGTVSGTVTVNPGGAPISGATVNLGARSTTTDGSGIYSFTSIPAGTYPSMNATYPGFGSASASSIVVTDGNITTQNFSLTDAPDSACLTDTTQSDFISGVATTLDLTTSPGDVTLSNAPAIDQQNTAGTTTGTGFGTPAWTAQTFIPAVTGLLAKADIQLFCNGCGAAPPNLTLSVRATSGGLPTGADVASTTIPGSSFASGATTLFTATFGSPATLTSGTQYALILRPVSAPTGNGYFWIRSSPSTYANGSRVLSANSGGTWSADTTRDYNFKTYMQTGYVASGNLISSPKDANPAAGFTPIWSTLSWNGSTPANTSLQFQVAGSNNFNGPFNFVGPDGTAGTFFTTSPAQLSPQFYNFRYLEYKTYLATTDGNLTPALNDATLCFNDVDCSSTAATITPTPAAVCTNSTGNTASGPAGMTSYAWGITNGTITSATNTQSITYTAGAAGTVTLNLTVNAPNGCIVSNSVPVTINPTPATPTITPGGPTTFCQSGSVNLSSSSATGNQWYLNGNPIGGASNQVYNATASGNYTVDVTTAGCPSAASAITMVTVNPLPATPTITPGGPTTFCQGGSVNLSSSSATGNQWYLNGNPIGGATSQAYSANASGNYAVVVTDGNGCASAPSTATPVTVNPLPQTPTINAGGPTTFCQGGSVTLTSSSATGNQWYLNGNPIGGATNNTYGATASGNYTVMVTDANSCSSSPSAATSVTVNPTPATPTITPGGATTFCAGGSVTLNSSAAIGNQWYLNGNPIGGAINSSYVATASGNYTVIDTALGCPSAPSTATTVTVNPNPSATITTTAQECAGSTGNTASVANAGVGATYNWSITNGTITGGTGTANITYTAGAAGTLTLNLTVTTAASCSDTKSANVTVNAIPAKPTITPGGPTTFATGGSVTLNSSSATGNQWFLNGNPIGGATNSSYVANAAGNYTVVVTISGCSSPASDATTVTICPNSAVVTNANDSGAGSLRQVILDACPGAIITFDMNQVVGPITLTTGELLINKNLTIQGSGGLTISGNNARRVFKIASGAVNISGLTITQGLANASSSPAAIGGGVYNAGNLTLDSCVISNNNADSSGGGIYNFTGGTLTITKSTLSGNNANGPSGGGGIADFNGSTLNVSNSTISGNTAAGQGGGLFNQNSTATLKNTTISGNTAGVNGDGGGIENHASSGGTAIATLTNCTIGNNTAKRGSAIVTADLFGNAIKAETVIANTLFAGNTGPNFFVSGTHGQLTDQGNNLDSDGTSGLTTGVNGNKVGTSGSPINALLGALANNGGPTMTMALLPGSPALDAGSNVAATNAGLTNDQRGTGVNRVVNGTVDIGAFESRGFTISATSGTPQSTVRGNAFGSALLATVSSAFAEPIVGGQVTYTAPVSGASATLTGGVTTPVATINASNQATVNATANNIVGGPYSVSAGSAGLASPATFSLTNIKSNQTITFNALGSRTFGDADFPVSATASSGLPVSFTASGQCTISTNSVHLTGAGSCTITAKQAGDSNFNPAADVPQSFSIAKNNQTITFAALTSKTFGDADFPVSATASSGLPVSFIASGQCTISTNSVHLTGAGSCTITAKQAGDSNFNAAADVPQSFSIAKSNQTITFAALTSKTFGDADFAVSATASSSLTVSFTASGQCTISTSTVHLTGAGSCTITAKQAGDSNYNAAPDVPRTFTIAQAATTTAVSSSANPSNLTQSVTFTATVSGPAGAGTPTGTATFKDGAATISCGNAGGQTFNASGVATCQTSALTAGSHTITAVYSGDPNFLTSTGSLSPNQFVNNLPLVNFSAANYSVTENDGVAHVIVNRSGDTTVPFNVDYATSDTGASTNCAALNTGLASSLCDYDTVLGTLKFAANQTQATIDITINQDNRTEGAENFTIGLSNATGAALLVNPSTATVTINDTIAILAPGVPAPNAIDDTTTFVRQQYHDFLNREPDAAGLAFWVQNIDKCNDPAQRAPGQNQVQCIQTQRVITSAAFFLSIEFMQTGTFVRSFYVAALDRPATNNMPAFVEWLRDTQAVQRGVIVNQGNWQATLDANRLAFMQDFVMRPEFVGLYPTTDTPTQYINKLYNHALGRTPTTTELNDAVSVFGGAATASDPTARGQALLKVTRAADFIAREMSRAFVQIEYFGYLRRNPNDAPDNNFTGYNFWLNKLNQFNGDFLQAEMVKAFIESPEYRQRFDK